MLQIYKDNIACHYFLPSLLKDNGDVKNTWERLERDGYYIDGKAYINIGTAGLPAFDYKHVITINGLSYIPADALEGLYTVVDQQFGIIYIYRKLEP